MFSVCGGIVVVDCFSVDVVGEMLSNLSVSRSRRKLVEKVLELGLVSDRKELRRKRARKSGKGSVGGEDRRRRKTNDDFCQLSDLVSDEHSSSSESTPSLCSDRLGFCHLTFSVTKPLGISLLGLGPLQFRRPLNLFKFVSCMLTNFVGPMYIDCHPFNNFYSYQFSLCCFFISYLVAFFLLSNCCSLFNMQVL